MGKKRAICSAGGLKSLAEKKVPGDEKSPARHRIFHKREVNLLIFFTNR
jgi:hypothetical protein